MPSPQEGGAYIPYLSNSYQLPSSHSFFTRPLPILATIHPVVNYTDSQPIQAARTLALQAAYRKAEANIKRDDAPSAGEIRRLGVLDAPLEEKNLKPSKWFPHKEIN